MIANLPGKWCLSRDLVNISLYTEAPIYYLVFPPAPLTQPWGAHTFRTKVFWTCHITSYPWAIIQMVPCAWNALSSTTCPVNPCLSSETYTHLWSFSWCCFPLSYGCTSYAQSNMSWWIVILFPSHCELLSILESVSKFYKTRASIHLTLYSQALVGCPAQRKTMANVGWSKGRVSAGANMFL